MAVAKHRGMLTSVALILSQAVCSGALVLRVPTRMSAPLRIPRSPAMVADDELAQRPAFQRSLAAAASLPWITHCSPLPPLTRGLISPRARIVLAFVVEYLFEQGLDADVLASGGYVRDLLMGRISDDLDLSLCLVRCAPDLTVGAIAHGMPSFAERRPDLGIEQVTVVTSLSDVARDKAVDAAQVCLRIGGEPVLIDLLPTISREVYDADDRIPTRGVRGTSEEDTLRRDLTIGAMLVHVTRPDRGPYVADAKAVAVAADGGPRAVVPPAVAAAAAADLQFVLLDFHGGIEDVHARVLRCPTPRDRSCAEAWEEIFDGETSDRARARQLGLEPAPTGDSADDERAKLQVIWWIKLLRDECAAAALPPPSRRPRVEPGRGPSACVLTPARAHPCWSRLTPTALCVSSVRTASRRRSGSASTRRSHSPRRSPSLRRRTLRL